MAKSKPTPEEVDIERIKSNFKRTEKICSTVLWCFVSLCVTVIVGIIAWATVRITEKPAWVTIILAILSVSVPSVVVTWRTITHVRRLVAVKLVSPEPAAEQPPEPPVVENSSEGEGVP